MALDVQQGTITAPAATGQLTVTTTFEPKVVLFWLDESTSSNAFSADANLSYGWAAGSGAGNQYAIASSADDAVTTNNSSPRFVNDACVLSVTDGKPASVTLEANIFEPFATTATGFKLDFVTTISGVQIHYLALGGADITNVSTGAMLFGGATGNQSTTAPGFLPDLVLFMADGKSTQFPGTAGKGVNHGAGVSSTERWAIGTAIKAQNGKAGKAGTHQLSTACILVDKGNSLEMSADFVSQDTNGFTVNVTTAKNDINVAYLAIKGSVDFSVKLGVDTQGTATGTKANTAVGFKPDCLLVAGCNSVSSTGSITNVSYSMGASDGTNESGYWAGNVDNPSPSTTADKRAADLKILTHCTPGTPTLDAEADLSTFDMNGFTLDWTTADGTAREFVYLALKGAAGATAVTGTINQATETDTGQALTPVVNVSGTIGQAVETDTAQSLTPAVPISAAIGQASETDTAQTLTPKVSVSATIAQATETDTSQAFTAITSVSGVIGQAVEADTSQTLTPITNVSGVIGQAAESDTSQALTPQVVVSGVIGQAVETDAAQTITAATDVSAVIGQATESDTAQLITGSTTVVGAISQATETDTAQVLTPASGISATIGQASETDTSQALTAVTNASAVIGQANESDSALNLTPVTHVSSVIGQAQETNSAQTLSPVIAVSAVIGQAVETDTSQALTPITPVLGIVGQAIESDSAQALKSVADISAIIGQVVESDTAQTLTPALNVAAEIGQAVESNTAFSFSPVAVTSATIGQAVETNTAFIFTDGSSAAGIIGLVVETELAFGFTPLLRGDPVQIIGQAGEINRTLTSSQEIQQLIVGAQQIQQTITGPQELQQTLTEAQQIQRTIQQIGKLS